MDALGSPIVKPESENVDSIAEKNSNFRSDIQFQHDIQLLKLQSSVHFNAMVQPI